MASSRRSRSVALLVAVLAAGCGGAGKPAPATPAPTASPTPEAEPPHISLPVDGQVVPASDECGDTRSARLTVTGIAQPHTKVIAGSGCQDDGCTASTVTDDAGNFTLELTASTSDPSHGVSITVAYDEADAFNSDRVGITLGPKVP
jgi:hypothetical protein